MLIELEKKKGNGLPLGVTLLDQIHLQFSIALPDQEQCILYLYHKEDGRKAASILMSKEEKTGGIFSVILTLPNYENYNYVYEVDGKRFLDPYAVQIIGREVWGRNRKDALYCGIGIQSKKQYQLNPLYIPYEDLILYHLHVRGFTMDDSSKIKAKGTFRGVQEKLLHLKRLGINGVLLMPCYEFDEVIRESQSDIAGVYYLQKDEIISNTKSVKLNYWGYTKEANYFAPKSAFAYDAEHPIDEMKQMIEKLHENQIEVLMEIYFSENTNQTLILDCLRYWVLEYGIDGFKINNEVVPQYMIASDPVLAKTKFLATGWDTRRMYPNYGAVPYKTLAEYNDGFMVDARRYLKGDEEQVERFFHRMKKNPPQCSVVNYISNVNGFTLLDLVSYDVKHNEGNGENGKDGTDYNYSWNCGFEGETRKKSIIQLRLKQIKNALLMLLLSQGTPMILAGDEFGNSQNGNNNAYCQDNEIGWVNWKKNVMNHKILSFTRAVIRLRKEHPVFHRKAELRGMDYIACGYPDISFHGTKPWCLDLSNYNRVFGIMLYGKYAALSKRTSDKSFYIAYNMHWEDHEYALPKLPNQQQWYVLIDTSESDIERGKDYKEERKPVENYIVKARTVVVFSEMSQENNKSKKQLGK